MKSQICFTVLQILLINKLGITRHCPAVFSYCWFQPETPILLFPSASVWFYTSGRLISGKINTWPNVHIIVLVPMMIMRRMRVTWPPCCMKLHGCFCPEKKFSCPEKKVRTFKKCRLFCVGFFLFVCLFVFLEMSTMLIWVRSLESCLKAPAPMSRPVGSLSWLLRTHGGTPSWKAQHPTHSSHHQNSARAHLSPVPHCGFL